MSNFANALGKTAVSGSVGLVQDLVVGAVNNEYNKQAFQREVDQEQRTYERNRQDYLKDLQNERDYNSASQQLARLRDAGLNPNIMNGTTPGMSSEAQPMPTGSMTGTGPTSVGSSAASGMIAMSTADVARSRADAQNALDYANAALQYELGLSEKEFRPIKQALMRAQEAAANGQANAFNEQAKLYIEQAGKALIEKKNAQGLADATIANLKKQADYYSAEGKLAAAKTVVEGLHADYQRVQNNWQKTEKWLNLGTSIVNSVAGIINSVSAWKLAGRMIGKTIGKADPEFKKLLDEMLDDASSQRSYPFPGDAPMQPNGWNW